MTPYLYLIRGLPGTGKSTLGQRLTPGHSYAADDYFVKAGRYSFDPALLGEAHADCQRRVLLALDQGVSLSVCNTFTQFWEMTPYLNMLPNYPHYRLCVIDLFDQGLSDSQLAESNLHGVPAAAIGRMRARYEFRGKK